MMAQNRKPNFTHLQKNKSELGFLKFP